MRIFFFEWFFWFINKNGGNEICATARLSPDTTVRSLLGQFLKKLSGSISFSLWQYIRAFPMLPIKSESIQIRLKLKYILRFLWNIHKLFLFSLTVGSQHRMLIFYETQREATQWPFCSFCSFLHIFSIISFIFYSLPFSNFSHFFVTAGTLNYHVAGASSTRTHTHTHILRLSWHFILFLFILISHFWRCC